MALWHGIKGLKYIYNGDYNDPQIEYKGIRFSEWEITDALHAELKDDIKEGNFPPEGMTFDTDSEFWYDNDEVFEEYLKWRGADDIYGLFDAINDATLSNNEVYDKMKENAAEEFDDDEWDTTYCIEAANKITKWAEQSEDNMKTVMEAFGIDEDDLERNFLDTCIRYEASAEEMLAFTEEHDIATNKCYLLYFQNNHCIGLSGEDNLVSYIRELMDNDYYKNIGVIVYSVNGTELQGCFDEGFLKEAEDKFLNKGVQKAMNVEELYDKITKLRAEEKLTVEGFGECGVDLTIEKGIDYLREGETFGQYIGRMVDECCYSVADLPDKSAFKEGNLPLENEAEVSVSKNGIEIATSGFLIRMEKLHDLLSEIATGEAKISGKTSPIIRNSENTISKNAKTLSDVVKAMEKEKKPKQAERE